MTTYAANDSHDALAAWACRGAYEAGRTEGRRNAPLNGTDAFRGAWQVAADYSLSRDTMLREMFTSGFLAGIRDAQKEG